MVQLYKLPIPYRAFWVKHVTHVMVAFTTLMLFAFTALAQDTVKGKVTDATTGETLPGVNILIKGTSNGTSTDSDGAFTIAVPASGTLVVSFVGYKTTEIAVNGQTIINVLLEGDIETLSEVVVVGYGSIEKKDVTGGVAKVNASDFNKGVINGADQLIAGKVAGLQIVTSGNPGGGSQIRLRGVSINGEFPLVVVDGVPLDGGGGGVVGGNNPLSLVNPSDIEDMVVLKDASASAIYGARGANGVIIITTKSGKTGKLKITYNGSYSASILTRRPDFLSPANFRAAIKSKAPQLIPKLGTANTDWMDEVSQLAQSTQQTVTLAGGKKKTNYSGSVNYLLNNGVLQETQNSILNLSLKVDQKLLNDNLKFTINTKNTFTNANYGPNVLLTAAGYDPTQNVYDPTNVARGGYYQWPETLAPANPVSSQQLTDNRGKTFRTLTNVNLQYDLPMVKGLSLKANIGFDYTKGNYNGLTYPEAKEGANNGGSQLVQDQTNYNQLYEYFATYKRTFGKHGVEATAGYAWQNFNTTYVSTSGDSLKQIDGEYQSTYNERTVSSPVENRLISFFGRVNYDYAGKYLITASLRRDGSTKFAPSNQWGLFPSAAIAWRVLEENFASPLTTIFSELKLRASYGVTGNEQIGSYLYSTYYYPSYAGASYQFGNAYVPTIRPTGVDPNIKWEETVSTNIGLDAGFFGGRLTTSIDFYNKQVNDLIFKISVPAGSNLSDQVVTNIGQVSNKGVEVILNGVAYDRANFKWNLSYNVSSYKNKIVQLDNLQGENLADFPGYPSGNILGDVGQYIQRRKVGSPVDAFYVYETNRNPDGSLVLDPNGNGVQQDIEMYKDQNDDGIINENDLIIYKKPSPSVIMGLTSNMTYKKWELAFTLKASIGNYVYNNLASAYGYYNHLSEVVTNNIHASAFETNYKTKQLFSDWYVQDASFLKLTNISLGYTFQDFSFGRVRANLTAQNVVTITGYKGVDPEIFNGIDNNIYPRSIILSLGVGVTFK